MTQLLPCPFCGKPADLDDYDTLYPNGIGWKNMDDMPGLRSYHSSRDVSPDQWCYSMHCPIPSGGCGAEISGDSKDEAIAAWNRRPSFNTDMVNNVKRVLESMDYLTRDYPPAYKAEKDTLRDVINMLRNGGIIGEKNDTGTT